MPRTRQEIIDLLEAQRSRLWAENAPDDISAVSLEVVDLPDVEATVRSFAAHHLMRARGLRTEMVNAIGQVIDVLRE